MAYLDEFVSLAGEFDISNARQISERVAGVLREGTASRVVLDLKGVSFLDCAAIRSILYAQRLREGAGRDLIVRHPAPAGMYGYGTQPIKRVSEET